MDPGSFPPLRWTSEHQSLLNRTLYVPPSSRWSKWSHKTMVIRIVLPHFVPPRGPQPASSVFCLIIPSVLVYPENQKPKRRGFKSWRFLFIGSPVSFIYTILHYSSV